MSSMPRLALKTSASKPGAIGVSSSALSSAARLMSSAGSEISAGGDPVHDIEGVIAQHRLGAHVEELDDPPLVGGHLPEVRALEDGVRQRAAGLDLFDAVFGN